MDISNLDKKSIKIQTSKEYVRPTNVPFLIGDMRKFMEKTNWMPKIDVNKILSDTLNYWRDRIENEKFTQLNTGKE